MLLEKSGWYCLVGSFGIFGWEVFFVGPVMFQSIWNADMMLLFHSWVMSLQVYFSAPKLFGIDECASTISRPTFEVFALQFFLSISFSTVLAIPSENST